MRLYTPDAPEYQNISPEKFKLVQLDETISDTKFKGKPIGFFKDATIRFAKNKGSLVAFIVIIIMIILSIFGPSFNKYGFNDQNGAYKNLPPRIVGIEKLGFLDGSRWLTSRKLDSVMSDTEKYPEGVILEIKELKVKERVCDKCSAHNDEHAKKCAKCGNDISKIKAEEFPLEIKGHAMCDIKVDYYKYVGVEEGTYFWMGTDYLGRDLWTRLWKGARVSLIIAFVSVTANVLIGLVYGSISGYYGGWVDMIMQRITEIIQSMPQIVIVTLFMLYFGAGMTSIIFALLIQNWIGTSHMIRTQFYRYKGYEYVLAARTLGVRDLALIFKHILPNSIGPIITRAMIAIPGAIFTESFLAYLGLGVQPPDTSMGILLSDGQKVLMQYPYQVWFPAVVISLLMIAFNMLANGLRDAFDPTQRGV
ncbi:MAG: ABC transporter permease subunit [Clostridia bacterium]|nr:ABC transporter permease subunit [Clostridia bacterium]